jgi:hypothetical protein
VYSLLHDPINILEFIALNFMINNARRVAKGVERNVTSGHLSEGADKVAGIPVEIQNA